MKATCFGCPHCGLPIVVSTPEDEADAEVQAIAEAAEGRVRREAALMHSLAAMAKAHAAAE